METRAAAGKGMLMKNANKSARVPQCVSTQQLPKSTPPQNSGNRNDEEKESRRRNEKESRRG